MCKIVILRWLAQRAHILKTNKSLFSILMDGVIDETNHLSSLSIQFHFFLFEESIKQIHICLSFFNVHWYFVSKSVLTYCDKKLLRILEQFLQTFEWSKQFLKKNFSLWEVSQSFYIGTTKMPIGTNDCDVKTYRNKLENIFSSLMYNVFWYLKQLDGVIDETNHLS